MILYCIFNEKERLEIIWKTRLGYINIGDDVDDWCWRRNVLSLTTLWCWWTVCWWTVCYVSKIINDSVTNSWNLLPSKSQWHDFASNFIVAVRVNAFGLWSILICFVVAVMELILGLSARAQRPLRKFSGCTAISNGHGVLRVSIEPWKAFTAILHYDDVVERLQLHKTLVELAERYPLYYG